MSVSYGEGYPYAQVFVPPRRGFACLEAMAAATNSLGMGTSPLVQPGEVHTSRFSIRPSFLHS